jgi:hypothetical protein
MLLRQVRNWHQESVRGLVFILTLGPHRFATAEFSSRLASIKGFLMTEQKYKFYLDFKMTIAVVGM